MMKGQEHLESGLLQIQQYLSDSEQNNSLGHKSLCISPPSTQLKKKKIIMKTICPGDSESPLLDESPASVTLHHSGFRSVLMGLRLVTQPFSPVFAPAVIHQNTEICMHHRAQKQIIQRQGYHWRTEKKTLTWAFSLEVIRNYNSSTSLIKGCTAYSKPF